MRVVITSDIHNNEVNLRKILDYCKREKIGTMICCGDLASLETLEFMNDNFSGNILYTFGNADYDDLRKLENQKKYRNTHLFKDFGEAKIEGKRVAFTHYPDEAKSLARTKKYDFVFYGHTHKPWEVMSGSCKLLNPGTAAGEIYPPTFAVWETEDDSFKLVRVHELK
jgi:putative phosphoesterase